MITSIELQPDVLETALQQIPADTPVVMLNLLHFRDRARYPDRKSGATDREAYATYSREAIKHVSAIGGEVILRTTALAALADSRLIATVGNIEITGS